MKYLLYLAFALFTFLIGVVISPTSFYSESIACGMHGSSTSYRSSSFMQTSDSFYSYDCEQHASDAFQETFSQAKTVIDSSPKVNKKGVLIEQRALAHIYHEGNDEYYLVLFWRDGKTLRRISSRSYTLVRDFEEQNF